MKVEEFMIGDWVNLNFDVDYKTGKSIYAPVQITGINKDGTVDVNFTYDKSESMQDRWDLKLIEPILLTSEIMEKNGYKRGLLIHEYKISDGLHYDLESGLLLFGYEYGTVLEIKCNYVHELQHVLKLCGIENDIIL